MRLRRGARLSGLRKRHRAVATARLGAVDRPVGALDGVARRIVRQDLGEPGAQGDVEVPDPVMLRHVILRLCSRNFAVSFELRLAHKDMAYLSLVGRELDAPLPLVNSLLNVLDLAKASGLGRENTNALVKLYEQILHLEVRGTL